MSIHDRLSESRRSRSLRTSRRRAARRLAKSSGLVVPRVESLEDRLLLSVTPSVSGSTVKFLGTSSDVLYLRADQSALQYSSDGQTFLPVDAANSSNPFLLSNTTTIDASQIGTTHLDAMTEAGGTIKGNDLIVDPGVTVSTRITTGDPTSAASTANSNNLTLDGTSIEVKDGAKVLAQAIGPYYGGNLELQHGPVGGSDMGGGAVLSEFERVGLDHDRQRPD